MPETEAPKQLVKLNDSYYLCDRHTNGLMASDGSAPLKIDITLTNLVPLSNIEAAKHTDPVWIIETD